MPGQYKAIFLHRGEWVYAPEDARVLPVLGHTKPHIFLGGKELRHCSGCNTWRPLSKYSKGGGHGGYQGYCVVCSVDYKRARKPKRLAGRLGALGESER